ncbi:MAG: MBL fold metallo-hydrolase, partial [Bdellovibrionota bacterium]|nr:MBL fold metallo-hydrolase [Bdellovibrionota bacterium]
MTIKSDNVFSITPIGGLGQIGSNMTLVSGQEESVIIDCGILFPNEDSFGVNYIIPSLEVLKKHDPKHLIITHGHEDHIGAISHILLAFPSIKVWSSPFSSELIKRKLKRDKLNRKIEIFKEKEEIEFNDFSVIPIHTNHSIPETNGLLFKFTSKNVCFFLISDFKFDNQTPYEPPMDLEFIKEKTKNFEKRLLLVDSTNIKSRNTKTFSEA